MPVNLDNVGIQSHSGVTLCNSVDYEKKLSKAEVPACDSGFGAADAFDPIIDFTIKGAGDLPVGLVIGSDGGSDADLTNINDTADTKRIITNVKEMEKHDDYNEWEISGTFYPGVSTA